MYAMAIERRDPSAEVRDDLVRDPPHLKQRQVLAEDGGDQVVELRLLELPNDSELSALVLRREAARLDLVPTSRGVDGVISCATGGASSS